MASLIPFDEFRNIRAALSWAMPLMASLAIAAITPAQAHDQRRYCPMVHKPVCAEVAVETGIGVIRKRRTFSNACFARINGARIIHRGRCRHTRPPVKRPPIATPSPIATPPPVAKRPPRRCRVWFDGCNICIRKRPGGALACTKSFCPRPGKARCRKWFGRRTIYNFR